MQLLYPDCRLIDGNFMTATRVQGCLREMGGNGNSRIEFIETHYDPIGTNLDRICQLVDIELKYDRIRTERQDDNCANRSAFMYPSDCNNMLDGCENNCDFANFDGFYCMKGRWH